MTITRKIISDKLLDYVNHRITLAALVDWAENTFIDDILAYLAAVDTAQFPLTWEICAAFLEKLGVKVQVIAAAS